MKLFQVLQLFSAHAKPLLVTGRISCGCHLSHVSLYVSFPRYNWSHAVLLYDKNGHSNVGGIRTCYLLMSTMVNYFKQSNITHDYTSYEDLSTFNITENLIRGVGVENSSKSTQIFIYFMFFFLNAELITVQSFCFSFKNYSTTEAYTVNKHAALTQIWCPFGDSVGGIASVIKRTTQRSFLKRLLSRFHSCIYAHNNQSRLSPGLC